jgi:hypothetical protein
LSIEASPPTTSKATPREGTPGVVAAASLDESSQPGAAASDSAAAAALDRYEDENIPNVEDAIEDDDASSYGSPTEMAPPEEEEAEHPNTSTCAAAATAAAIGAAAIGAAAAAAAAAGGPENPATRVGLPARDSEKGNGAPRRGGSAVLPVVVDKTARIVPARPPATPADRSVDTCCRTSLVAATQDAPGGEPPPMETEETGVDGDGSHEETVAGTDDFAPSIVAPAGAPGSRRRADILTENREFVKANFLPTASGDGSTCNICAANVIYSNKTKGSRLLRHALTGSCLLRRIGMDAAAAPYRLDPIARNSRLLTGAFKTVWRSHFGTPGGSTAEAEAAPLLRVPRSCRHCSKALLGTGTTRQFFMHLLGCVGVVPLLRALEATLRELMSSATSLDHPWTSSQYTSAPLLCQSHRGSGKNDDAQERAIVPCQAAAPHDSGVGVGPAEPPPHGLFREDPEQEPYDPEKKHGGGADSVSSMHDSGVGPGPVKPPPDGCTLGDPRHQQHDSTKHVVVARQEYGKRDDNTGSGPIAPYPGGGSRESRLCPASGFATAISLEAVAGVSGEIDTNAPRVEMVPAPNKSAEELHYRNVFEENRRFVASNFGDADSCGFRTCMICSTPVRCRNNISKPLKHLVSLPCLARRAVLVAFRAASGAASAKACTAPALRCSEKLLRRTAAALTDFCGDRFDSTAGEGARLSWSCRRCNWFVVRSNTNVFLSHLAVCTGIVPLMRDLETIRHTFFTLAPAPLRHLDAAATPAPQDLQPHGSEERAVREGGFPGLRVGAETPPGHRDRPGSSERAK